MIFSFVKSSRNVRSLSSSDLGTINVITMELSCNTFENLPKIGEFHKVLRKLSIVLSLVKDSVPTRIFE